MCACDLVCVMCVCVCVCHVLLCYTHSSWMSTSDLWYIYQMELIKIKSTVVKQQKNAVYVIMCVCMCCVCVCVCVKVCESHVCFLWGEVGDKVPGVSLSTWLAIIKTHPFDAFCGHRGIGYAPVSTTSIKWVCFSHIYSIFNSFLMNTASSTVFFWKEVFSFSGYHVTRTVKKTYL